MKTDIHKSIHTYNDYFLLQNYFFIRDRTPFLSTASALDCDPSWFTVKSPCIWLHSKPSPRRFSSSSSPSPSACLQGRFTLCHTGRSSFNFLQQNYVHRDSCVLTVSSTGLEPCSRSLDEHVLPCPINVKVYLLNNTQAIAISHSFAQPFSTFAAINSLRSIKMLMAAEESLPSFFLSLAQLPASDLAFSPSSL